MNQFKRAQVIMLPTEKVTTLAIVENKGLCLGKYFPNVGYYQAKNLYIISDDEIKEGDWRIVANKDSSIYGEIAQHDGKKKPYPKWKKIIATTDTSLYQATGKAYKMVDGFKPTYKNLPQPSQQFIEKYIEFYNKGEVITDVLVEYDYVMCPNEPKCINCYSKCCIGNKLKINPKDNTITIKKLKDNFTLKELKRAFDAGMNCPIAGATFEEWFNKIL